MHPSTEELKGVLVVLESFVVLKWVYILWCYSVFYGVKVCICGIKNVFVVLNLFFCDRMGFFMLSMCLRC